MNMTFSKTSPDDLVKKASGDQTEKLAVVDDPRVGEDILSQLVKDNDWQIRAEIARKGYGLDLPNVNWALMK